MEENIPQNKIKASEWISILISFIWAAGFSSAQAVIWFTQDTTMMIGSNPVVWHPAAAALGQFLFLLPPFALGAWFWRTRSPRMSGWFETLALAAFFPLFMLPLRFYPASVHPDRATTALIFQFLGLSAYAIFLWLYQSWHKRSPLPKKGGFLPALLVAPFLLPGWWYFGAFGGIWELVTNVMLGLFYGLVLGRLLGDFLFKRLYQHSAGTGKDILIGSHAIGAVLLITATSFGYGGQTLLFLLFIASISLPLMAILQLGSPANSHKWDTAAWLIGISMATMLAFADVDEMTQILAETTDPLPLLGLTAILSALLSRILSFFLFLLRKALPKVKMGAPLKATVAFFWILSLALLFLKPNAGFYNDHLFVIFDTKADLSAASNIADIDQRRAYVYEELKAHANASQAEMLVWLDRLHISYQPYYLVNAVEVNGGAVMALWLAQFEGVDRVLHNPTVRATIPIVEQQDDYALFAPEPAPTEPQWNLTMIGADRVWETFNIRGAGITLGQSDSGVQWDHPELLDSYRGRDGDHNYDWLDIWEGQTTPYDLSGHGTHTTGSVLGNTVGVAPDAEWFACANLVRNLGSPSKYLACMQFMLAPYPMGGDAFLDGDATLAADVLNNSWGCPTIEGCDPNALKDAVEALRAAGIFVVASAGNDGYGGCETVKDPIALYDASFSVGAHDILGQVTSFSSRGPVSADGSNRVKPDILAPGENVLSSYPGDKYMSNSGTSMAGPHIAGVVALIWSANPDLIGNIDRTEEILVETATPYDFSAYPVPACGAENIPNNIAGYGLVNAYEAVKMALEDAR